MEVGDLVKQTPRWSPARLGIITHDLKNDRCMVFFFDTSTQYDMDKSILEVLSESR
jgi:hypothetical protein